MQIFTTVITASLGVACLSTAVEGYFITNYNYIARILALAASLSLIKPGLMTDVLGLGIMAFLFINQMRKRKLNNASGHVAG